MGAIALPEGNNAAVTIRRLRAIDAEFFGTIYARTGVIGGDVLIEGNLVGNDIYSSNWNGAIPIDLSGGADAGASAGYALDGSVGAAQFQSIFAEGGEIGNLTIVNALTMGSGGVFRTAASGRRVELSEANFSDIEFYSGNGDETTPARIIVDANGGLSIFGAVISPETGAANIYLSGSGTVRLSTGSGSRTLTLTGPPDTQVVIPSGSAARPGLSFPADPDTGIYWISANVLGFTGGGVLKLVLDGSAGFFSGLIYNITTGAAANTNIVQSGLLARSTSASKYKRDIDYDVRHLADIELKPTKHWRIDDKRWRFSLINEDLKEQDPLLVDDESPDYNAIIAIIVEKINRLEEQAKERTMLLDEQEERIYGLEDALSALTERVAALKLKPEPELI